MNTTLLALNASYSHTSLAARYLRSASNEAGHEVKLVEMTVNERAEVVSRAVFDTFPDVLCCSVYIWNVRVMSDVCVRLK
ncbi:MAG TPA: cobalamin-dependent protein, partial [Bacillota bacterium]|nr:cobalamin-dependent protein [Bacillota bacterium]